MVSFFLLYPNLSGSKIAGYFTSQPVWVEKGKETRTR